MTFDRGTVTCTLAEWLADGRRWAALVPGVRVELTDRRPDKLSGPGCPRFPCGMYQWVGPADGWADGDACLVPPAVWPHLAGHAAEGSESAGMMGAKFYHSRAAAAAALTAAAAAWAAG